MNSSEQRTHRTVTAALGQQCADLLAITEALDARVLTVARIGHSTLEQVGTLRTDLDTLKLDTNDALGHNRNVRKVLCTRVEETRDTLSTFRHQTFRQRVRWLLTGR